jgi:hypothetical protein
MVTIKKFVIKKKVARRDECKSINYGNNNSKIITVKECGSLLKFLERIYE